MRPNMDKEFEVVDLDRLFEEYLETDALQQHNSETTAEPSSSGDLAHLFELPSSNGSASFETSLMPNWDATGSAWHKALEKLEQNPASPVLPVDYFSIYPESRGKASLSDPELLSFDDIFELDGVEPRTSLSQPSTPRPDIAKPTKKATPNLDRPNRHGVYKTPKRSTLSSFAAKMMRPSHCRTGLQDLWGRKMDSPADAFSLDMPTNGMHSPPPSAKFLQDNSNGFLGRDQPSYTIDMSPLPGTENITSDVSHSNYQLTPLSSPAIDINPRNGDRSSFQFSNDSLGTGYISHISSAALSALQTPPSSHRLPMATWDSETPTSLDFSFPASPEFQAPTSKDSSWWNNNSTSGSTSLPMTQPSTPQTYQTLHSRSTSQSHGLSLIDSSSASLAGLGISCDSTSFGDLGPELNGSLSNNMHGITHAAPSSFDMDMPAYTTLYTPHPSSHHGIPIGHPQPRTTSSRSPSLSPQPRFTRRRHSSHNRHRSSTRQKSSNSSSQSNQRSGSGSASAGFVNFTPDDSRRILTGVAPSGSSKTKARREKEAAEKRRKLKQAAMKAVIEAGGDIKRLEKEGLLVLEGYDGRG